MIKTAAVLTIHNPEKMTDSGKKSILKWLRHQCNVFDKHSKMLAPRFTSKFQYKVTQVKDLRK